MKRAADLCTGLRVVLAPVLAWQLALPRDRAGFVPLIVFLIGAATDAVDGMLARAAGTASSRGRLFDHGADALLLFPAFAVLVQAGKLPLALPVAATIAFALYLVDGWRRGRRGDGWRRGGGLGAIELTASRSGALGGVLNYLLAGAAAAAVGLDVAALDQALYAAAFAIAAVNAAAAFERIGDLLTTAPATPAAEKEPRARRSSP
jgi:phosphatidylglycerophosphate synthase